MALLLVVTLSTVEPLLAARRAYGDLSVEDVFAGIFLASRLP